jgi:hypothetical protein
VVTALWTAAPARAAQIDPPALSASQFVAEIDRLIGRIDAADDPGTRAALIASLPSTWRIAAGDREFHCNSAWVSALLGPTITAPATWSATRTTIRTRLIAIREEVTASVEAAPRPAHAREALARILSREEFQRSATSRWREELQRRVGEWIEDLLTRLGGGPGSGRRVAIALAWIASIGALAGLGVWLVRAIAQRTPGTALGLSEAGSANVRARELALRSLAAARAGDVREAVRIAHRAALVRLEEQGVWRVDDARTPREYLTLLRRSDGRHATMADLTRRFEQIWYGNQPAAFDDAAHVRAHLEELGCLRPGEQAI